MSIIKTIRDHGNRAAELSWSAEERLRFIEAAVFWDGRVNRSDLIQAFGISVPQATIDLKRYQELAPKNLRYDPREKAYLASEAFAPCFETPRGEAWLSTRLSGGQVATGRLIVAEVPQPARALDPFLLRRIVRAAQEGAMLRLRYQSMDHADPASSWFVPRAFVTNGQRWHLRAYNVDRDRFEDLLFPRIIEIEEEGPAAAVPVDTSWERRVNVLLRPSGRLSPTQRAVIASDYSMTKGETVVEVRVAELFLFLRRLGVDREGALIEVVNRDEVDAELSRERAAFGTQIAEP